MKKFFFISKILSRNKNKIHLFSKKYNLKINTETKFSFKFRDKKLQWRHL